MASVRIPPTLRPATKGERQIEAQGADVREILDDVVRKFPELGDLIYEGGELAPFVNVYLDGEDVRTQDGLDTPATGGAQIILLPAMAGGAR